MTSKANVICSLIVLVLLWQMAILCDYRFFFIVFPYICRSKNGYYYPSLDNVFPAFNLTSSSNITSKIQLLDTDENPFVYLEKHNYHYENHTITTEDGYILLTVRIPDGKNLSPNNTKRPPVIFIHGLFSNFYDFLNAGPGRAIGFEILEEGYDIWLLNTRGNTYSRRHTTLDPVLDAANYWNFSWHEIGIYDIPANMDYIKSVTGYSNVSFVGHSQGGTVFFAMAASRPEYDKRITFSVQLAPVVYLKNAKQLVIAYFRNNMDIFEQLVDAFQLHVVLQHNELFTRLGHTVCGVDSPLVSLCTLFIEAAAGPSSQSNGSLWAVLSTNDPAGGSVNQIRHFLQIAVSDKFQLYDYGREGNKITYDQETPPLYDLSVVKSPVGIYYGKHDYFISSLDAARLVDELPNVATNHRIMYPRTNHLDVQWGTKAVPLVHRPAIQLLNKYNKKIIN